mmetsp:Transcript_16559/g.52820  ORF Transcript_16559/g.52820 Transcript_16559/m.52820 type:complete len:257 (+) Transcript_16559:1110-1880(+)
MSPSSARRITPSQSTWASSPPSAPESPSPCARPPASCRRARLCTPAPWMWSSSTSTPSAATPSSCIPSVASASAATSISSWLFASSRAAFTTPPGRTKNVVYSASVLRCSRYTWMEKKMPHAVMRMKMRAENAITLVTPTSEKKLSRSAKEACTVALCACCTFTKLASNATFSYRGPVPLTPVSITTGLSAFKMAPCRYESITVAAAMGSRTCVTSCLTLKSPSSSYMTTDGTVSNVRASTPCERTKSVASACRSR